MFTCVLYCSKFFSLFLPRVFIPCDMWVYVRIYLYFRRPGSHDRRTDKQTKTQTKKNTIYSVPPYFLLTLIFDQADGMQD